MFHAGQKVRALVDLMSDDRENGIADDSPVVAAGTIGTVVGSSKDEENTTMKRPDCWVVNWGVVNFDTAPEEMEAV